MKKVVLAYSGGLDTSCAVRWLADTTGCEVVCFSAFLGEVKSPADLVRRGKAAGASKVIVKDLRREFARDFVLPALFARAVYEGGYYLSTALGRPLIAKHLVDVAHAEGAQAVAHGCTRKGNDQVRIEVGVRSLDRKLKVIAPLREWEFKSRDEEIEYARENRIPIKATKKSPYSIDKNIWGVAIEAGMLEDPWVAPPEDAFLFSKGRSVPRPREIRIGFEKGVPARLNGRSLGLVELIEQLNAVAGAYRIGRSDMIESRLVGIKSREVYEAPAACVLYAASAALENLVFDRSHLHLMEVLSHRYAELVYDGLWFSPLKRALDAFFRSGRERVTGEVRVRLESGRAMAVGRRSPHARYAKHLATYSAGDRFDHTAAAGFVKLWGLPYERLT